MIRVLIFSCLVLLFTQQVVAQKIQGRAVYRSSGSISLSGINKFSEAEKAAMQKQMAKALTKDYELSFNNQASTYKQLESLESSNSIQMGEVSITLLSGDQESLYKNIESRTYTQNKSLMGKAFLIQDQLEQLEWELVEEHKEILGNKCQKAQLTQIREITDLSDMSKTKMDTVHITAWFATEIPIAQGPEKYWGLPGLILEISKGNRSIICTELELNSGEELVLEIPKKGRKVSQEEYDQIMDEKLKQMKQGFKSKGQTIRLGGR